MSVERVQKDLAVRLVAARERGEVPGAEIAHIIGVSEGTYWRLECGDSVRFESFGRAMAYLGLQLRVVRKR